MLPVLVEKRFYPAITEIFVAIGWRLAYVLSVRNLRELLLMLLVLLCFLYKKPAVDFFILTDAVR